MKRKSPIRHKVHQHLRKEPSGKKAVVHEHMRGNGLRTYKTKMAKPIILGKIRLETEFYHGKVYRYLVYENNRLLGVASPHHAHYDDGTEGDEWIAYGPEYSNIRSKDFKTREEVIKYLRHPEHMSPSEFAVDEDYDEGADVGEEDTQWYIDTEYAHGGPGILSISHKDAGKGVSADLEVVGTRADVLKAARKYNKENGQSTKITEIEFNGTTMSPEKFLKDKVKK